MNQTLVTAVIVLVALGLAASILLPTSFQVERSIQISRPQAEVYQYLSNLKNRKDWTIWFQTEPSAQARFEGAEGQVGSQFYWKGEKMGEGQVQIQNLIRPSRIETTLSLLAPMQMTSEDRFEITPISDNLTEVKWINRGELAGFKRIFGLFADSVLGKDYASGLLRLKEKLDNN